MSLFLWNVSQHSPLERSTAFLVYQGFQTYRYHLTLGRKADKIIVLKIETINISLTQIWPHLGMSSPNLFMRNGLRWSGCLHLLSFNLNEGAWDQNFIFSIKSLWKGYRWWNFTACQNAQKGTWFSHKNFPIACKLFQDSLFANIYKYFKN